jgi:hypothetical protein
VRFLAYLRRKRDLREVHTTAQLDLRDGLLEARADRIAELEALLDQERIEKAKLIAELATYKTQDFMRQALRLRRRQTEQPDRGPARHRLEAPTEVHPRVSRRREPST